jgi:hypothetical protein
MNFIEYEIRFVLFMGLMVEWKSGTLHSFEDSEGLIGPGIFGVALNVDRWGVRGVGADFWDYGAVSEEEDEEEEGFESLIIQPSSRFSLINPPGGIINNIGISRVVIISFSGSLNSRESKKIVLLKITFFLGRISSY